MNHKTTKKRISTSAGQKRETEFISGSEFLDLKTRVAQPVKFASSSTFSFSAPTSPNNPNEYSMQKSKRASFGATDNAAAAAERRSRIAAIEEEKRERALHKEVITKEPDVRIHPEELQKIDEMARTLSIRIERDKQVDERKRLAQERAEAEREKDMAMLAERDRILRLAEEREKKRTDTIRQGAKVITSQIHEREMERLRQLEQMEREREVVLSQIQKLKEQEKQDLMQKKKQARDMHETLVQSNTELAKHKVRQAEAEKEEERAIMKFVQEKEDREAAYYAEIDRKKSEREKEWARLRAAQQRDIDRRGEMDALRAQRETERVEREWREKEKGEQDRKWRMQKELDEDRRAQLKLREEREIEKQKASMLEQEKARREHQKVKEEERARMQQERQRHVEHKEKIKEQIEDRKTQRQREEEAKLREGEELKKIQELKKQKLEALKREKLEEIMRGAPKFAKRSAHV